jgi:hypothetical protein
VKASSTVLNGGREETCHKVTRLAPTHRLSEQVTGYFSVRTSLVFVPNLPEGRNASAELAGESAYPRGYDATDCYRGKKQQPGTALSHIFVWSGYSFSPSATRGDCSVARIVVSCAMLISSRRRSHDAAVTPPSASGPPPQEGLEVTVWWLDSLRAGSL